MGLDLNDTILWLGRGDPNDPGVNAMLRFEKGNRALERGDDNQAIAEFREAVLLYDAMPEEWATLNNTARVLLRLSELTGDRAAFDRGFAKMEKAQKLQPSDSINLVNLSLFVVERSLSDIIGPAIDLQLLKQKASLEQLAFLYNDHAGHKAYVQRLRTHAGIDRQIALLEKALLLAPAAATSTRCLTSSTPIAARRKSNAVSCNVWSTLISTSPTKLPGRNPFMPAARKSRAQCGLRIDSWRRVSVETGKGPEP